MDARLRAGTDRDVFPVGAVTPVWNVPRCSPWVFMANSRESPTSLNVHKTSIFRRLATIPDAPVIAEDSTVPTTRPSMNSGAAYSHRPSNDSTQVLRSAWERI